MMLPIEDNQQQEASDENKDSKNNIAIKFNHFVHNNMNNQFLS